MRYRPLLALAFLACSACRSPSAPTSPAASRVVFTAVSPPPGSRIVVSEKYPYIFPGGVVLPPGSGLISVGLSMTSAHEVPWAQLNVYLLTGGTNSEYCGQNSPDSPTWSFLPAGWTTAFTVTGFRVYRLPSEVTGLRAMLHVRNNGLGTPPTPSETIAEATFPVSFELR